MAGIFESSSSPATFLAALLLLLLLLHCIANGQATPTEVSTGLDESWIDDTVIAYNAQKSIMAQGFADNKIEKLVTDAEKSVTIIKVRQDGTGDFKSVTDAVNSIPKGNTNRVVIKIGSGVYKEKVMVDRSRPYVTFYGNPNKRPTISYQGSAAKYGTWNSATVIVEANYFVASNIIFENTSPCAAPGQEGGQAVAFRISGDKAAFYNCNFHGFQDTLCDDIGMHYFKDCLIRGTVDFIFGNGRSIYRNCTLQSVAKGETAITAHGRRDSSENSGFSFIHCNITGTGNAYLSRAWRASARVVVSYTYMDHLVNPKGWDDKGYKARDKTVYYGEYKCMGPGATTSQRVGYAKLLKDEQAQPFLSLNFINGGSWLQPPPTF